MARSVMEGGSSKAAAARAFHTTPKTVAKWIARFRAEGAAGLQDRSSRPHSSPGQTPPATCERVEALRRQRHTGEQIAAEVGVSAATISRILKRLGLNRLSALEPAEPIRRYERATPGEIVHIDIKKLGKFNRIGHRDHRRAAPARASPAGSAGNMCIWRSTTTPGSPIRKSCRTRSEAPACAFLFNALRFFRSLGVKVERIMTDNGSSFRSHRYAKALRRLRIKHLRTKPYTPRTTDVIDKWFFAGSELFSSRARATAWRRAGREAQALPRSLHRRPSVAAPVRACLGPRGFQPATKRAYAVSACSTHLRS